MIDSDTERVVAFWICLIALPLGLLTGLLKFIFSPLCLPPSAKAELEREQNLLAGILLLIFGCWIGIATVYALLLAAFVRELRSKKKMAEGDAPAGQTSYLFPRIALEELMAMVFGMAAFPILVFGTEFKRENAGFVIMTIVLGALLYPLCCLAAYNRVNASRVPVCAARTAYIALFPLMLFACVFQPMALLVFHSSNLGASPYVQLGLGALATVCETLASWKCARAARDLKEFSPETAK